ncbi:DUF262 domain-containing HNH endonuclease family protein [Staphylococcus epidermidis]|uniref:DUF262 domain-containing protein n=1 Tax=Staphylococcus epidermidis TaxID=1282 RepID=UPI001E329BFC|nr:DUF262 domain-containing protein [Staphylococcus epidermidis]MCD8887218.1 DUF262 domain-containing HNH endonuclease family protein [Staphylococcus epidermidis]
MKFDARSGNFKSVLTAARYYRIPRFQRDFSWDKNNYHDFLFDLISQIKTENNEIVTTQYFFGNMLFLGEKEGESVEVVDGQQRLTTATILLAALRNTLYNTEIKKAKDYAETIQSNYLIKKIDGEPQRKLQTASSYPYFTQTIQDYETSNKSVTPETEEEEKLQEAFDYFLDQLQYRKLKKFFSFKDISMYIEVLKSIREQLLNSEIIEVFVTDRAQANKIFENINSKGKPLSQVDLIKNIIFSKIDKTEAGVDEIADTWLSFNKKLVDVDSSFDEFFLHFWKATYPEDNPNGRNLYSKFLKRFENENTQVIKSLIDDIEKKLNTYIDIIKPDSNKYKRQEKKYEEELLDSITKFKGVQVRVALLALFSSEIKIKDKLKKDFLLFLSNFHFAAFGIKLKVRSNQTTIPYKNFSKDVKNAKSTEDIKNAMIQLKLKLMDLIYKSDFINAFKNLSFSKLESRKGNTVFPAQYAIKRIANDLQNRDYNDDEYSIEHIINESKEGDYNNIGNLIVLETNINQNISQNEQKAKKDFTFSEKRNYYKKSNYYMVKKFLELYPEKFEKNDIKNRSERLAKEFWETFLNN